MGMIAGFHSRVILAMTPSDQLRLEYHGLVLPISFAQVQRFCARSEEV